VGGESKLTAGVFDLERAHLHRRCCWGGFNAHGAEQAPFPGACKLIAEAIVPGLGLGLGLGPLLVHANPLPRPLHLCW
jgi:hypothetical protein